MDPLTQGLLGATAAQALGPRSLGRHKAWIGWLAGMAADLDVLIRSSSDPLLGLEYHRHFTHSFAFVPIGAVAVALPLWGLLRLGQRRTPSPDRPPHSLRAVLLCCLVAYLTHAPLDACTSYGTLLFWPFSDHRVAWDWLPVVDPVVTLALLLGWVASVRRDRRRGAALSLAFFALYLALAALLHARAEAAVRGIAAQRQHRVDEARAMPKLPTIFIWRGVYRSAELIAVDTIRAVPGSPTTWAPGGTRRRYRPPATGLSPALQRDIERFDWFAQGFTTALDAARDGLGTDPTADRAGIVDLRYGPQGRAAPLWGIRWDPASPRGSLAFVTAPTRSLGTELEWQWHVLRGRAPGFRTLDEDRGNPR